MGITSIDQITIGFSFSGLERYLQELNGLAVEDTINNILNPGRDAIVETTDTMWTGSAAEAFKRNYNNSTNELASTLREMRQGFEGSMRLQGQIYMDQDDQLNSDIGAFNIF